MANRKIKLEIDPRDAARRARDPKWADGIELWDRSEPFAMSEAGILVHRVRYGMTLRYPKYGPWGKDHHHAITYWCGNSTTKPVMLYDIPGGRMVCARCEAIAAAKADRGPNGKPQKRAADIVGHSVNLGALVPVKVGTQRVKRP